MKKVLTGLGSVLLGGFVGYALFAWGIPALGGGEPSAGAEMGRGFALLLLPAVLVGMLGVLAAHELGHVAGGRLAGLRFLLLIVGPLKVVRTGDGGLDFSVNRSLGLAGGLAACGPDPDDLTDLRRRARSSWRSPWIEHWPVRWSRPGDSWRRPESRVPS